MLILGIFILLLMYGVSMVIKPNFEDRMLFSISIIIATIFLVVISFSTLMELSNLMPIEEKIEMYSEENENIEAQIGLLVENYMKYESKTFGDLKNSNAMTLVSLYPELKSDQLVQAQISIYQKNSQKIKELKEQKLNASVYRWLLYFGH